MEGTAVARTFDVRRFWKRYGMTLAVLGCGLAILLFYTYVPLPMARSISNMLRPYRGSEDTDPTIAYVGLALVVMAQGYTLVKRVGVPEYIGSWAGRAAGSPPTSA